MRTETDSFENDSNDVMALLDEGEVLFCFGSYASEKITKQQAAEFARQILEMCGEGEDEQLD